MPEHEDTYPRFREIYGEPDINKICRVLIFLKIGRLDITLMDRKPYTNWKKSDYLWWTGDTTHLAANLGKENRYTMQITATLKCGSEEQ